MCKRKILVGINSKLYQNFREYFDKTFTTVISHKKLKLFKFFKTDSLYLFSYPKKKSQAKLYYENLKKLNIKMIVYLSSASCNNPKAAFYNYGSRKLEDEMNLRKIFKEKLIIIRSGTVVDHNMENSFCGCFTTKIKDLINLFELLESDKVYDKPITIGQRSPLHPDKYFINFIIRNYSFLLNHFFYPPILRPIDFLFKILGVKAYGYSILRINKKDQIL